MVGVVEIVGVANIVKLLRDGFVARENCVAAVVVRLEIQHARVLERAIGNSDEDAQYREVRHVQV